MKKILDLINGNTYVISDHHWGHKKINKYEPYRLEKAKELGYNDSEKMMIDLWNKTIKKDDIVLYLGDFCFSFNKKIVEQLNGRKFLILGNHDRPHQERDKLFEFVFRGLYIEYNDYCLELHNEDRRFSGLIKNINGKEILFSHYPMKYDDPYDNQKEHIVNHIKILSDFYDSFGCELNIHGHVHSNEKDLEEHINVSCEVLDFVPVKIGDLIS
jgi:calcineurin-like phosphoesterase family protein